MINRNLKSASAPSSTYLRFTSVGDSFSRPIAGKSWAQRFADLLAQRHDVSFCEVAEAGATTAEIRLCQIPRAQAHRPNLAALTGGLNDVYRGIWDAETVRYRLMRAADELAWCGAALLTVRFLEVGSQARRICQLNEIYDEIDDAYGSLRVDLADMPQASSPDFWSIPSLQPSPSAHHQLAERFVQVLADEPLFINRRSLAHAV